MNHSRPGAVDSSRRDGITKTLECRPWRDDFGTHTPKDKTITVPAPSKFNPGAAESKYNADPDARESVGETVSVQPLDRVVAVK